MADTGIRLLLTILSSFTQHNPSPYFWCKNTSLLYQFSGLQVLIQKFITLDNLFNRLICKKYWEIENSHYGRSSSRTRSSKPGDRNWNERLVLSIVEDCKLDSSECLFIWKLNKMLIVARVTQLLSGISFPYKYRILI